MGNSHYKICQWNLHKNEFTHTAIFFFFLFSLWHRVLRLHFSKKNTTFRDEAPLKQNPSLWIQNDSFLVSLYFKFLLFSFITVLLFCYMDRYYCIYRLPIYFTVGTNFSGDESWQNFIKCSLIFFFFKYQALTIPMWYAFFSNVYLTVTTKKFQCLLNCHHKKILSGCSFYFRFYFHAHLNSDLDR